MKELDDEIITPFINYIHLNASFSWVCACWCDDPANTEDANTIPYKNPDIHFDYSNFHSQIYNYHVEAKLYAFVYNYTNACGYGRA
jgi:hypothetical protein